LELVRIGGLLWNLPPLFVTKCFGAIWANIGEIGEIAEILLEGLFHDVTTIMIELATVTVTSS
jgi:hypothetical protein